MREIHVVLFLANHPARDTARDVTELRGLAKSQVSAAVDLLAARELLRRRPDKADRRVIHLALTDAGAALAREGQKLQSTCLDALFAGLTQSEAERFQELLEKVLTSAEVRLKEGAQYMSRRNVDLGSGSVGKLLFSLAVAYHHLPDRQHAVQPGGPGVHRPHAAGGDGGQAGPHRRGGVPAHHHGDLRLCGPDRPSAARPGPPSAGRAGKPEEAERIMGNSFTAAGGGVRGADGGLSASLRSPCCWLFGASDNTIGYAAGLYAHLLPWAPSSSR